MEFSVAMCVYGGDHPAHFQNAVESIRNQTRRPNEIVLVVDGPVPPALDQVICRYEAEPLFTVVRLRENQGHGKARAESLRHCTKQWIALMDADDLSCPDRFEKQLRFAENHPECDIVGGQITEFQGDPSHVVGERIVPLDHVQILDYARKRCPMNQVTVLFKKASVEKAGGYIDWHCEEDYYLWVRMIEQNMTFANLPDVLVHVRVGDEMYQRRGGWQYFVSERRLQKYMLKKHLIGAGRYTINVTERLILQVLMPNKVRGLVFRCFARKKVS